MKSKLLILLLVIIGVKTANSQSNFIGSGVSLEFDGDADNYYNIGDVYNTLNFPVTFETWVYQTEYSLYTPLFATDSYTSGNYYGFYIRFNPTGKLIFEIGSGTGAGGEHRRGKITTSVAPLNKWIHVAIVANSITDIKFYFNGVLQGAVNTDGTSGVSSMVHNSNPCNLGRYATVHRADAFIGQMDESRLWSVARTETEVRQNMCKKLTGAEIGLIGYWKVDESYVSSNIDDYSISNFDGTEIGVVNKLTSGAPIGDVSVYNYALDYTGVSLSLNSPGGDKLKVNKIVNSPHGVQVYRVNSTPYSSLGLNDVTNYYYGVFTADAAVAGKYTITYTYSFGNGVVNEINESEATIYKRVDGSVDTWTYLSALLNTTSDRLTKKNIATRDEFIFNVNIPNGAKQNTNIASNSINKILISPNPSTGVVNFTIEDNVDAIEIYDIKGVLITRKAVMINEKTIQIDISNLQNGLYLVRALRNNVVQLDGKFEVINN